MSGSLSLDWGSNGGLYFIRRNGVVRLCLGPVAVTYWGRKLDVFLREWL